MNKKHGMSNTKIYRTWSRILNKTTNKNSDRYKYYGNRGIKVCDSWHDFLCFKNDMEESMKEHINKYGSKNTTLERIDNSKGYSPDNCRWATQQEQCQNRRNNNYLEVNGKRKTIAEWSRVFNIDPRTMWSRIFKHGWNVEEALTTGIGERIYGKDKKNEMS